MDLVDPSYDFIKDRSSPDRERYWDENYPHELLGYAPYDGLLVSKAIVGGHIRSGKYTESQAMRFKRIGARSFLRFEEKDADIRPKPHRDPIKCPHSHVSASFSSAR